MAESEMEKRTSELSSASESFRMSYNTTKPSWLASILSDLDYRMKTLALKLPEGDDSNYSFRERADFYYDKRPQLIELLRDLYNGYIALSDKYTQSLLKQNHRCRQSSHVSFMADDFEFGDEDGNSILIESDMESSLSFHRQHLPGIPTDNIKHADDIVTDLVMKNVEHDILKDQVIDIERQGNESSRTLELQKSLLDNLETERSMLLNENAHLCSQMTSLAKEKKRVSLESLTVKRKANETARLLLKMRDRQRKNMVQKIEDLQRNTQKLEEENECYVQLVSREYHQKLLNNKKYDHFAIEGHRNKAEKGMKKEVKNVAEVNRQNCHARGSKMEAAKNTKYSYTKNGSKLWGKMKTMGLFHCGSQSSSIS